METEQRRNDPFGEQDRPPSSSWRPKVTLPIVITAVIIAVIAFVGLKPDGKVAGPDYCDGPSGGLVRMGGECIGVTDGSYVLADQLAPEEQQIVQQNAAIGQARSVTVAVFDPLTPDASSALDIHEIQHQVQGAIAAQKWVNQDADSTNSVRVRLVLANQGSHQQYWPPVVEQLNRMQSDPSPLVAVVGMGVSVQPTLDAAKKLSQYRIPAIGGITTAADLNQAAASSFFRVSPSTTDYAKALKPWVALFSSGLLVYDAASDDPQHPDIFTRSMRNDFRTEFGRPMGLPEVNYHGTENSAGVQANRFGRIRDQICTEKTPLVLFAGRRNDLQSFVGALEDRQCQDPVTVMVGGTNLGGLAKDEDLKRADITLVWASATDPTAWVAGKDAPAHFGRFLATYRSLYGNTDLADGEAVAGYDALITVATAAKAVEDESDDASVQRPLPHGSDVRDTLLNTDQLGKIPAASGDLSYRERGARSGDPLGKPIPVIQQGVPIKAPDVPVYYSKDDE